MHYRRLSYRYALVLTPGELRPLGDLALSERRGIQLAQTCWRPPADVYETAGKFIITIELAGVDHEALDVLLFEDALVVEGQRRIPPAEPHGVYHTVQIQQGHFRIEIPLPGPVDGEQVDADYDRGLLQITLTKAQGG